MTNLCPSYKRNILSSKIGNILHRNPRALSQRQRKLQLQYDGFPVWTEKLCWISRQLWSKVSLYRSTGTRTAVINLTVDVPRRRNDAVPQCLLVYSMELQGNSRYLGLAWSSIVVSLLLRVLCGWDGSLTSKGHGIFMRLQLNQAGRTGEVPTNDQK